MGDDAELLQRWHRGDKTAGNELFARHFPALRRFFRNKVGHEEAEDLIQRTMLETVRSAPSFRGEASFRTFIFTIARRELCHHIRRKHRKGNDADIDFSVSSLEALGTSPSGFAAQKQDHQRILAALRAIPLDFQITLELHYWEQLDGKELAEVLGIAPGTVRSRLHRARAALRELLESREGAPATEDLESSITAARPRESSGNAAPPSGH
ncbi:MAG: RNA polymerase sigma factor [Nannocystaceae bacterium]|nr:RNA polymerase sigma factor [Nannocystaceae bacterium]